MKLSRYLGCSPTDAQNQTTEAEGTTPESVASILNKLVTKVDGLETAVNRLETAVNRLETAVDGLVTAVNRLETETFGTAGREATQKLTISLFVLERNYIDRTWNEVIHGHGILLRCSGNEFAILTAGHVAITLFSKQKQFTKIEFVNGTTYEVDHEVGVDSKLFLADDYIKYGTCDVGALVIRLVEGPQEDSFQDLVFSGARSFDTKFIGRSFGFSFQCYPFRVVGDRVGLRTPSTGECSGTPMFSSKGELLSVLHGGQGHHGRNRYASKKSSNVHSRATREDSESVYVDTVKELDTLKQWDRSQLRFIEKLEFLDDIGCKNATKKYRKPSCNDLKYEHCESAEAFYRDMEILLGSDNEAFMKPYFTIPEICDHVIRAVQNEDTKSLDQCLVSCGESTYSVCAPSE